MVSVFNTVALTITSILQDATIGFNATLAELAANSEADPFILDFGDGSSNFFQARALPADIDTTSDEQAQYLLLYGTRAKNANYEVGQTFSGDVEFQLKMILSFPQSTLPEDAEALSDLVGDTFLNVFDSTKPDTAAMWVALADICYNNNLDVIKDKLEMAGEGWNQVVTGKLQVILSAS